MTPAKPSKPKAVKPAAVASEAPQQRQYQKILFQPLLMCRNRHKPTVPPAAPAAADDLNQPGFPLHPERIWPD